MSARLAELNLNGTGSCASFNFRRAARAVTRLYDQALEPCGIRSTQFTILVGVATTLTRSLRLLKNQGLVSVSDRGAKRKRFLALTPKGERTLAESLPVWRAAQERFVQSLGADYWTNFRGELERLAHVAIALEKSRNRADSTRS